jgi:pyridoxine kinase
MQVVTSLDVDGFEDSIVVLGSSSVPQARCPTPFYIKIPRIKAYFSGCGDLLAALLLAHTAASPGDLATATEKATATLQEVLQNTLEAAGQYGNSPERTAEVMSARELQLVQSANAILEPKVVYRAIPWE